MVGAGWCDGETGYFIGSGNCNVHAGLYIICPNETREFDVLTKETQGALKDHVRGIYLDSFYKSKSEGTTLYVEFTKS